MNAIETVDLKKSFGKTVAFSNLDLVVKEGNIHGLIGPDGAGKTTLIRVLSSLLKQDKGEAMVMGLDPLTEYRKLRKRIGYMPGRFSLYQDLSVYENLQLFASLFNTTITDNYELIRDIYSQIEPFKDRKAGALSGGMKQKLALSCAMIHRPDILFLDEPTTGVDPVSRKEFWDMLKKLNAEGLTILVSTPYMDEAIRCHEISLIQNGQIMAESSPEGIIKLYDKQVFDIYGPNKFAILRAIEQFEGTFSIYAFGEAFHFTPKSDDFKPELLDRYMKSKGVEVSISPSKPGIEDTFMYLMKSL
jgi:ABC-type multidrug transport system ATPase subunit